MPPVRNTKVHHSVHNSPNLCSESEMNIVHTLPSYFFKVNYTIIIGLTNARADERF
jgi:hypothetical protein